jgi:hypothetical protein
MRCPYCTQNTPDSWKPWVAIGEGGGYTTGVGVERPSQGVGVPSMVSLDYMHCANDECKELIVRVHEEYNLPGYDANKTTWFARPQSARRPIEPEVPEPFRTDYLEAAAILDLSPRMSAVLSRRILADLLEQYAGQKQHSLEERIDNFINDTKHPRPIRENLHHFREIANFGAYTQKNDQAEIIDVSRDEAEWTLDILDRLFDYFIVDPEKNRKMREGFDKKLGDAGRRPISPLPDDPPEEKEQ